VCAEGVIDLFKGNRVLNERVSDAFSNFAVRRSYCGAKLVKVENAL